MKKVPEKGILETLLTEQVKACKRFEALYALYEFACVHQGQERSYETVRHYVDTHIEQRRENEVSDQASAPRSTTSAISTIAAGLNKGRGGKEQEIRHSISTQY